MVAFAVARDCFPLYALYSLLFADAGLSTGEIGGLLILWSAAAFVLEVPSGAWADMVDRRLLLALGAVLQAVAFAVWMIWPVLGGFAVGFLLWSLASALQSGSFEALVHDELARHGATERYARVIGLAQGAGTAVMTGAIALAAPLYAWGGYPLVGWTSVALALLGVAAALALPRPGPVGKAPPAPAVASTVGTTPDGATGAAPRAEAGGGEEQGATPSAAAPLTPPPATITTRAATTDESGGRRYRDVLRDGIAEAVRTAATRRVLLLLFLVVVLVAVDEYFPLLAAAGGTRTGDVPWWVAACSLVQAGGTALVGWTARWRRGPTTLLVLTAGLLLAAGALVGQPWGLALVAVGYGLANNAMVAAEVRLQETITSSARATVTSVGGLVKEAAAITGFALVAGLSGHGVVVAVGVTALVSGLLAAAAAWRAARPQRSP